MNSSPNNARRKFAALTIAATAMLGVTATAVTAHAADGDAAGQAASKKIAKDLWANIDGQSGGVVSANNHVPTSERLAVGTYIVTFDRPVDQCGYSATPAAVFQGDLAFADTGIAVSQLPGERNTLRINTRDLGKDVDLPTDSSFSIIVDCATP